MMWNGVCNGLRGAVPAGIRGQEGFHASESAGLFYAHAPWLANPLNASVMAILIEGRADIQAKSDEGKTP